MKEDVRNTSVFFDISYYFNLPLDQVFNLTNTQVIMYQHQIERIRKENSYIHANGVGLAFNGTKGGDK